MDGAVFTFGRYGATEQVPRQWFAALFTSSGIYAGLIIATLTVGFGTKQVIEEKPVDLTFVEKVVKEEPPPSPVVAKPVPPPAAAPVIPKNMKIRKLDAPPPVKELIAPKEMPLAPPKEADPSEDRGVAVYGEPGTGDPAGLEGGIAGSAVAIALPEEADPPLPSKSNSPPLYPQDARAAGKTGTVVLKVIIRTDGRVADVQVMRGEEPFVSAAVQAVKTWTYQPARFNGRAIMVYRIIQIPFKLNA
jgi:protein TonB